MVLSVVKASIINLPQKLLNLFIMFLFNNEHNGDSQWGLILYTNH